MHFVYQQPPKAPTPIIPIRNTDNPKLLTSFGERAVGNAVEGVIRTVITAPIKFDQRPDLLGISHHDDLLDYDIIKPDTGIDPACRVKEIYFSVGDELYAVNVESVAGNVAQADLLSDTRRVNFNFQTDVISIYEGSRTYFGEDTAFKIDPADGHLATEFFVHIQGEVQTSKGLVAFTAKVVDLSGKPVTVTPLGYTLTAFYSK